MSLRAWDPEDEEWVLLLNWPGAERTSFGILRGNFRHGRGEFFSGSPENLTRYSFSDTLPGSIRWDSARSTDGGETWRTDWIMEFTRTAPAASSDAALFDVAWETEQARPLAGARELDFLVGSWSGVHRELVGAEEWRESRAQYRAASFLKGWALVESLRIAPKEGPEQERLTVRGFLPGAPSWECWSLARADTRLTSTRGSVEFAEGIFRGRDRNGPLERRILLEDDDVVAIEEHRERNGTWSLQARTELHRELR